MIVDANKRAWGANRGVVDAVGVASPEKFVGGMVFSMVPGAGEGLGG